MTKIGRSIYENGMEEGREEGREEGKRAEKRKTAEKMLRRGEDMAFIMELTDLTEEEIKEIEEGILVSQ